MRCQRDGELHSTGPSFSRSSAESGLAVIALLFLAITSSAATECSGEVVVGGDDEYTDSGISLGMAPDGTAWVVWMGRDPVDEDEEIYFSRSTEDGWSEQQRLHDQNLVADRFPKVSFGQDGIGWVVWYKWSSSGARLYVSHGGAGGWSPPEPVHPGAGRYDDKTILAIDSTDVWMATATYVAEAGDNMILAYHWQGAAWEGPWQVGVPGRDSDHPDFGVDETGRLWLVWLARNPATAVGPIMASTWTGAEWTEYQTVSDDSLNGGFPQIVFDGDVPMVTWNGNYDTTHSDIKYSRLENGHWTPDLLVNLPDEDGDWDYNRTCSENEAGMIAAVWDAGNDYQVFSPAIYMSWWNGGSWTPEKRVSEDRPYKRDRFPAGGLDGLGGLWVAWECMEPGYLYTFVRSSVCTQTTPVSFGPVVASASGDSVVVRWVASGEAAGGPFTVWRSSGSSGETSPGGLPPSNAVLISEQALSGPPFAWTDHEPERGAVNRYWVCWDAPDGTRCSGPASAFVEAGPGDEVPARVLFTQPNPSSTGSCFHCTQRDEGHLEVALYTAGGRLVRTVVPSPLSAGERGGRESTLCWDGMDEDGRPVASGVYLWQLSFNGAGVSGQTGTVTLVR